MFEFASSSWNHLEFVGSCDGTRRRGAALAERALIARKRLQVGSSAAAGDHCADGLLELVQTVELGVSRADLIHAGEMGVGGGGEWRFNMSANSLEIATEPSAR